MPSGTEMINNSRCNAEMLTGCWFLENNLDLLSSSWVIFLVEISPAGNI